MTKFLGRCKGYFGHYDVGLAHVLQLELENMLDGTTGGWWYA